ncbi:type VII secretion system-associated protein [Streptomyces tsukubensis]|uniref:SseB protein N-terminal domain-containing protein n=1 Tax=Streptomyces tsukubensis TaxID=83656 RepID=A0A1V4A565_9ACTN|nr:type VII secretion system-associated protein [Streptomyces tsukubensis]OON76208.1 hypothetical protein B1H18_21545 [Streptomyces tsukubensis]
MSETTQTAAYTEQAADAPEGEGSAAAEDNMPQVPEEIREAAKLAPDHWLGMVDPTWQGEGPPPAWALVGQWRSSPEGEIVEWEENEEYQPSPKALGWPEPADPVDAAVQLAATGYGPGEDVTTALAEAEEVAVFLAADGSPLAAVAPDGETPVVPVFTSPSYLHTSGRLAFALHPVHTLLKQLPEGHLIYLNPSAPVSMTVDTEALREAVDTGEDTGEDLTEDDSDSVPDVVGNGIPVMGRAVRTKATETKTATRTTAKAAETKPTATRAAASKTAAAKTTTAKSAAAKSAATKSASAKAAGTKAAKAGKKDAEADSSGEDTAG